jgi:hypothetical protein
VRHFIRFTPDIIDSEFRIISTIEMKEEEKRDGYAQYKVKGYYFYILCVCVCVCFFEVVLMGVKIHHNDGCSTCVCTQQQHGVARKTKRKHFPSWEKKTFFFFPSSSFPVLLFVTFSSCAIETLIIIIIVDASNDGKTHTHTHTSHEKHRNNI